MRRPCSRKSTMSAVASPIGPRIWQGRRSRLFLLPCFAQAGFCVQARQERTLSPHPFRGVDYPDADGAQWAAAERAGSPSQNGRTGLRDRGRPQRGGRDRDEIDGRIGCIAPNWRGGRKRAGAKKSLRETTKVAHPVPESEQATFLPTRTGRLRPTSEIESGKADIESGRAGGAYKRT
jgi:hypothetical protein